LPISVSKNMFLRDLDFYGIVPSEGTVKTSSEAWAVQVKDCLGKMKNLEEERKNLGIINDIDFLANHCAGQYLLGISCVPICYPADDDKDKATKEKLRNTAGLARVMHKKTFQNSLSKFWLRLNGGIPDG